MAIRNAIPLSQTRRQASREITRCVVAALDGGDQDIHHPSELLDDLVESGSAKAERLNKKLYESELELRTDLVKIHAGESHWL